MTAFVLVHGAWGGSYGWRKVRRLLWQTGHDVFTPSLTGLGERSHLTSPQVTLSTHVQDVVNTLFYEDLRDVTLVGYSYGGMVVTGCVDHVADRIKHLVYLDAFVPNDGQSLHSLVRGEGQASAAELPLPGNEWLVKPPERSYDDPEDAAYSEPRRAHHPVGCFAEPVRLSRPLEEHAFSLTYIKATGEPRPPQGGPFWTAADRTSADARWRYYEIATNHMIPFNRPEELTRILLEVSQ
jgi:pimeloyl-ACP methyl ester carboxylesterase